MIDGFLCCGNWNVLKYKYEKRKARSEYVTNNKWVFDKRVTDKLTQAILLF